MSNKNSMDKGRAEDILGLDKRPYSRSDLLTTYRKHARQAHPDAGGDAGIMMDLNAAYVFLKDLFADDDMVITPDKLGSSSSSGAGTASSSVRSGGASAQVRGEVCEVPERGWDALDTVVWDDLTTPERFLIAEYVKSVYGNEFPSFMALADMAKTEYATNRTLRYRVLGISLPKVEWNSTFDDPDVPHYFRLPDLGCDTSLYVGKTVETVDPDTGESVCWTVPEEHYTTEQRKDVDGKPSFAKCDQYERSKYYQRRAVGAMPERLFGSAVVVYDGSFDEYENKYRVNTDDWETRLDAAPQTPLFAGDYDSCVKFATDYARKHAPAADMDLLESQLVEFDPIAKVLFGDSTFFVNLRMFLLCLVVFLCNFLPHDFAADPIAAFFPALFASILPVIVIWLVYSFASPLLLSIYTRIYERVKRR